MVGLLHVQYMLILIGLLLWSVHLLRRELTLAAGLVLLTILAVCYDNLIIALGAVQPAGPSLLALSWARYVLHIFAAPLTLLIVADLARRSGVVWLGRRTVLAAVALIVAAMTIYGALDLRTLTLLPLSYGGAIRYIPAEAAPPLLGLVATLAALVAGVVVWRMWSWPWLAAAALVVLVAGGVAPALGPGAISPVINAAEVALLAAMLGCERMLRAGRALHTWRVTA